jgi:hypothetical protein
MRIIRKIHTIRNLTPVGEEGLQNRRLGLRLCTGNVTHSDWVCQDCGAPWKGAIPQWEAVPPGSFRSGR